MARNRKKNKAKKKKLNNESMLAKDNQVPSLKERRFKVLTFNPGVVRPPRYVL